MAEAEAAEPKKKPGWGTLFRSLRHPKSGYMLLFGFAQGLPPALFLGTLYALSLIQSPSPRDMRRSRMPSSA